MKSFYVLCLLGFVWILVNLEGSDAGGATTAASDHGGDTTDEHGSTDAHHDSTDEHHDDEHDSEHEEHADLTADPVFVQFAIVMIVILSIIFAVIFVVLYICNKDLFLETIDKIKLFVRKLLKKDANAKK